jgi:hypothetical protein
MQNADRAATYRHRVSDLRAAAQSLSDRESKRLLLEIPERYERAADRIGAQGKPYMSARMVVVEDH